MTIIEWSRPVDYTLSCILDKKRNTDKEMQMGGWSVKLYKQYRSKPYSRTIMGWRVWDLHGICNDHQ